MSQKRAKQVRRQVRKQQNRIAEKLIHDTLNRPFKHRVYVAWKILRGKL